MINHSLTRLMLIFLCFLIISYQLQILSIEVDSIANTQGAKDKIEVKSVNQILDRSPRSFLSHMMFKIPIVIAPFNSSYMLPIDYQQSYCPLRCHNGITMEMYPGIMCYIPYCHVCSCERPACEIYDNCCPDVTDTFYRVVDSFTDIVINPYPKSDTIRYSPVLTCDEKFSDRPVLYIHSCPPEYDMDVRTRELCEQEMATDNLTLESFTHVKDESTGVLYWNTYCARCNGVNQSTTLPFQIQCKHFMNVYTETELVHLLRAAVKHCVVVHITHEHEYSKPCVDTRRMKYIDSCNSTNSNSKYNQEVATACQSLNKTIHKVFTREPEVLYKNLFCAICHTDIYYGTCLNENKDLGKIININRPIVVFPSTLTQQTKNGVQLPFSQLLNIGGFSSRDKVEIKQYEQGNCSHEQWASPDGDCLPLNCSAGKVLEDRNCTTAFEFVKGLSYNLQIVLTSEPEHNQMFLNKQLLVNLKCVLEDLNSQIAEILKPHVIFYMANLNIAMSNKLGSVGDFNIKSAITIRTNYKIVSSHNFTRDDMENIVTDDETFNNLSIILNESLKIKLRAAFLNGELKNCSNFHSNQMAGHLICLDIKQNKYLVENSNEEYYLDSFINLRRTLTCSFVCFNKSNYILNMLDTDIPPIPILTIYLKHTKLIFTKSSELNLWEIDEHGVLKVCVELLDRKLEGVKQMEKLLEGNQSSWDVAYILTLTCVSASMVCLLLTLVTYIWFPVLRNTAGKNTMFLCATLLLAQCSLLASSHLTAQSMMCTASGISTHFLWLWMLSWSFTCSYHMFQIFTSKAPKCITAQSERRQLYKNVFRSLILPSVAVSMVVIFSYVYTEGQVIGYGHVTCYLDSPLLNGVTFVGPLTMITISNVVFFGITVYKIQSTINLQSAETFRKDNQHHIYVYIKLSLMTGAFWTLAIVAETVDNQVLRIISIILNGLQGVAIFVSYVCNKRVFNMYWNARGRNSTMISVVERNK